MGLIHKQYLNTTRIYGCSECRTHLSAKDGILSTAFQGQHGRAYLFGTVINVVEGPSQDRPMTTGMHTVRDIRCSECHQVVGWKYIKAYEESQKYKENRYILEKELLVLIT